MFGRLKQSKKKISGKKSPRQMPIKKQKKPHKNQKTKRTELNRQKLK
jgi:hypothetical protein